MKTAIELIAAERQRQQSALGWTREHDDQHTDHEIAINAAACLLHGTDCALDDWRPNARPDWGLDEKHKADRVRQLTIAGALVAAELDRVIRARALANAQGEPESQASTSIPTPELERENHALRGAIEAALTALSTCIHDRFDEVLVERAYSKLKSVIG